MAPLKQDEIGKVVIAGAGQAGISCARALRTNGFRGSIVMLGEEQHPPYDRPPLSKAVLMGESTIDATYYLTLAELADYGIEFLPRQKVVQLNRSQRTILTSRQRAIGYDHLVLATGARVRRLSLPGTDEAEVRYLRDIDDCQNLKTSIQRGRRILVIGGGLIGLEVAAAATKLGAHATVIEVENRVLGRIVGREVSDYFEALHRSQGVTMLTGRKPSQIRSTSKGVAIEFEDGTMVDGDMVVAGIGVIPNDAIAAEAGLTTSNGIWVDEFGVTDDPRISAAGDVANHFNPLLGRRVRLETWQNAKNQATVVARNLCGSKVPYVEYPWGWSDQFGTNLQLLGMPAELNHGVIRGDVGCGSFSVFYLKEGLIEGMTAVNAVRDVAASRRLMADKVPVDAERLANPAFALKSFLDVK